MSSKHEGVDEGGQNGPSEVSGEGSEAMLDIARHLAVRALRLSGELTPDARIQLALRSEDERVKLLEDLVLSLAPDEAQLSQWVEWLDGGVSPFPKKKQQDKVGVSSEWPSQTLMRTSPRVGRQQKKVEAMRAQLQVEEARLKYAQAHDKAAMQWFVTDHLIALLGPVFAMGPAWTVMRSMSAHLTDERAEEETALLFGNEKTAAIEKLRKQRVEETQKLLEVLDLGSGNSDFEADLRSALLKVVMDWDQKRERLTADRRRPRAKKDVAATIHPKSREGGPAILEGLKKTS